MKQKMIWIFILGLFLCLIGTLYIEKRSKTLDYYIVTDYQEVKELMKKEETIIIDVRTNEEYKEGHIENAINIPLREIEKENLDSIPNKKANYILYCASGTRSREATKKLAFLGYKNVYDYGSIKNWDESLIKTVEE